MQARFGKILRKQTETRNDGRPAETRRREVVEGDGQHVARLRAIDKDGPGHRVDPTRNHGGDVGGAARGREMTIGGVAAFNGKDVTGCHGQDRRIGIVPSVVAMGGMDGVLGLP